MRTATCELGELGDDLDHELRDGDRESLGDERTGLLQRNGDLGGDIERIVGADLRSETILERCDDAPTVRVVLRIG